MTDLLEDLTLEPDAPAGDRAVERRARDVAEEAARRHLMIDTLTPQRRDHLDFHDCGVVGLRAALAAAYRQGLADAGRL
ncbi:MAG: hypothetical protein NXI21_01690 [Alphaproteobacteria bacterium]|nr:hypothetical protein [Alphaproteobacteria bacterium]